MVALAAANATGVILFGTLYTIAGRRLLSQVAFVACLVVLFALVTALWVRTEARHAGLGAPRRLGRIALGLLLVLVATPVAVLAPLFWLDAQIPVEAGLHAARGGIMALLLIALILVVFVNVAGSAVAFARAALRRPAPPTPS